MKTHKFQCCICKKEFERFGNNPHPVKESGRCCDECNKKHVIPTRIKIINEALKDW